MYLRQEIDEVQVQIDQRDNKCQSDLGCIGDKIGVLTKVQEQMEGFGDPKEM